jgi:ferric-dicitrate binding protein FerR (iron transport regulator)
MKKELLTRYIAGTCDESELNEVIEWFRERAGSESSKALLHQIWEETGEQDDSGTDFDAVLSRIHHQINIRQTEQAIGRTGGSLIGYKRRLTFLKWLRNIAAILLIPVAGFSLYMILQAPAGLDRQASLAPQYELTASVDAIAKATLPDGSEVWLNHGSTIRYPAVFQKDTRQMELIGEGYFKVAHHPDVPFIVNVGALKAVARGTEFNLQAYPGDSTIEASLAEGRVDLLKTRKEEGDLFLMEMKPSERASFDTKTNKMVVSGINDERYWSWKEGKLIFINENMDVVVRKLSRWFNVDIEIRDKSLLHLSYTATFVNESLTQVMELMAMATPIRYSVAERREISEGLFSKRKVIIRSRNK